VGDVEPGELEAEEIIRRASELFLYTREELFGRGMTRHLVRRRQALFYALRELTDMSYPCLARLTGFDHSTIMHAVVKVRKEMEMGGVTAVVARRLLTALEAIPVSVEFY